MGKKKAKRGATVSETLRGALEQSGLSLYRVAKNAGLAYAIVHRFMRGERTLSMEALDKLCASLGLELQPKQNPSSFGRAPRTRPEKQGRGAGPSQNRTACAG